MQFTFVVTYLGARQSSDLFQALVGYGGALIPSPLLAVLMMAALVLVNHVTSILPTHHILFNASVCLD